MSVLNLLLNDEDATLSLGRKLAFALSMNNKQPTKPSELLQIQDVQIMGAIVYLTGDLGSGKTTLTRGIMRGFGYNGAVKSPTYTIIEPYEFDKSQIYHFDLYRLSHAEEVEYLGAEEYFSSTNLCLIEWPERGQGFLPLADLVIELAQKGNGRSVTCKSHTEKGFKIVKRLTEKGRNL